MSRKHIDNRRKTINTVFRRFNKSSFCTGGHYLMDGGLAAR